MLQRPGVHSVVVGMESAYGLPLFAKFFTANPDFSGLVFQQTAFLNTPDPSTYYFGDARKY